MRFTVELNAKHPIYKGHFPDMAIVPGAVFTEIVKDVLEQQLERRLRLKELKSVKFMKMVIPQECGPLEIVLSVTIDKEIQVSGQIDTEGSPCCKIKSVYY